MTEKQPHQDKESLLSAIHQERQALDTLIAGLSITQKCIPGVVGDWSVKDIMAHIAAWERFAQDRIHSVLTGQPSQFPVIENENFVDIFNLNTYEANKDIPLDQVESEYKAAHAAFMEQINSLDEEFLHKDLPFDWAVGLTAIELISANTHWHYPEHTTSIRNWLQEP